MRAGNSWCGSWCRSSCAAAPRRCAARIAAQVVTGIGFLGAGCIIQERGQVKGLTTAATIWVVAAIGIIAGAGFPVVAFIAASMVLITLTVLGAIERRY